MPSKSKNLLKRDIRFDLRDSTGSKITSGVILDVSGDPTEWKELPPELEETGKLIKVERGNISETIEHFDITIDRGSNIQ